MLNKNLILGVIAVFLTGCGYQMRTYVMTKDRVGLDRGNGNLPCSSPSPCIWLNFFSWKCPYRGFACGSAHDEYVSPRYMPCVSLTAIKHKTGTSFSPH